MEVLTKIVVWIQNTFDDNFGIKNDFTKYLKDHFSINFFPNYAFLYKIS